MALLSAPLPAVLGGATPRVFPQALLDNGLKLSRVIEHRVGIQETTGGREIRESWWITPRNHYRLTVDVLRVGNPKEFQKLVGWYSRHGGPLDSWLIKDGDDCAVAAHYFGKGDGTSTIYQLQRTLVDDADLNAPAARAYWPGFGDGYEPIYEPDWGTVTVYVDGVATGITQGTLGRVTFSSAPASGALLSWTGNFNRRVRFASDLSLDRIVPALWQSSGIDLIEVKP